MDASAASSGRGPLPSSASKEHDEAALPEEKGKLKPKGRSLNRPEIDLDATIEKAKQAARDASKALALARSEARANRKRRTRLLNKAATLSPEDLERIAVLQRTGQRAPEQAAGDADASTRAAGDADTKTMKGGSGNPSSEDAHMAKKKRVTEQDHRTSGDEGSAGEESDEQNAKEDKTQDGEDEEE